MFTSARLVPATTLLLGWLFLVGPAHAIDPEVKDQAGFFKMAEAKQKINPAQVALLEELKQLRKKV